MKEEVKRWFEIAKHDSNLKERAESFIALAVEVIKWAEENQWSNKN